MLMHLTPQRSTQGAALVRVKDKKNKFYTRLCIRRRVVSAWVLSACFISFHFLVPFACHLRSFLVVCFHCSSWRMRRKWKGIEWNWRSPSNIYSFSSFSRLTHFWSPTSGIGQRALVPNYSCYSFFFFWQPTKLSLAASFHISSIFFT
jgi:hypothetical protein